MQADLVAKLEEMREEEATEMMEEHALEMKQVLEQCRGKVKDLRVELTGREEALETLQGELDKAKNTITRYEGLLPPDTPASRPGAESSDDSETDTASLPDHEPRSWFGQRPRPKTEQDKDSPGKAIKAAGKAALKLFPGFSGDGSETSEDPPLTARRGGGTSPEERLLQDLASKTRQVKSLEEVRDMLGAAVAAKDDRIHELGEAVRDKDLTIDKLEAEAAQRQELTSYLKAEYSKKELLIDQLTTQISQQQSAGDQGIQEQNRIVRQAQQDMLSLTGERDMLAAALQAKDSKLDELMIQIEEKKEEPTTESSPARQELASELRVAEMSLSALKEEHARAMKEARGELKGVEGVRDMLAGLIQEKDNQISELQDALSLKEAELIGSVGSPLGAISELGELGEEHMESFTAHAAKWRRKLGHATAMAAAATAVASQALDQEHFLTRIVTVPVDAETLLSPRSGPQHEDAFQARGKSLGGGLQWGEFRDEVSILRGEHEDSSHAAQRRLLHLRSKIGRRRSAPDVGSFLDRLTSPVPASPMQASPSPLKMGQPLPSPRRR